MPCNNTLFGGNNNVIKYYGSDLIAVEGANTIAKLPLGDIRIPYKQVITNRIILKPAQTNYLLNFLGLGNAANLLAITATYDLKSKIEPNNFMQYNYFDDFTRMYSFSQVLTLTGNSTNRVKQIYLHNPSATYSVTLNVMCAVIDDTYSFFNDADAFNQMDTAYSGVKYTDINSWVSDSIVIFNTIIELQNITSMLLSNKILIITDSSAGHIYLDFIDLYNANQAHSLISWAKTSSGNIQDLDGLADLLPPTIYFTPNINLSGSTFSGTFSFNSDDGTYFISSTMSLGTFSGTISKSDIIDYVIDYVYDYRGTGSTVGDGLMSITYSNITISGTAGHTFSSITASGTYSITFNIVDIATNSVDSNDFVLLRVGP